MATSSYPQQGLFPADGPDCGPYTANEWRAWFLTAMRAGGMVNTGAAAPPGLPATPLYPNVGVYYVCPNRLEVTSPGASQISIDTGAGLCDGTFFYNDTAITATPITNPAGNPRIDRVVVRQNYSAVDYTSVNAPALIAQANTADLVIISGAEAGAPVAPTLTQDQDRATYWDIPLAQYQISVAGVITNLTDEREWVDAEMKLVMVQAQDGWNVTDGNRLDAERPLGFNMVDNKETAIFAQWAAPQDFISTASVTAVIRPLATGNAMLEHASRYGACSQLWNTHNDVDLYSAIAVTNAQRSCVKELSLTSAASNDLFSFELLRNGANVNDTINDDVTGVGFLVEYLGWGRK